jgi:hypothetical protein
MSHQKKKNQRSFDESLRKSDRQKLGEGSEKVKTEFKYNLKLAIRGNFVAKNSGGKLLSIEVSTHGLKGDGKSAKVETKKKQSNLTGLGRR